MADHNPPSNSNSVNPLFNMMDQLMARHRNGPAASLDDIPVLTEVASKPIPSLHDVVDDIPALTDIVEPNLAAKIAHLEMEWAITHDEPDISHLDYEIAAPAPTVKSLTIDPLPFQKTTEVINKIEAKQEVAAPMPRPTPLPIAPATNFASKHPPLHSEPQFLDLPMLDLDELTRAPEPDYLDLPELSTARASDLVTATPTEHFIATDLMLPLDDIAEPAKAAASHFADVLTQTRLAADEVPHLDLDAILSLEVTPSEPEVITPTAPDAIEPMAPKAAEATVPVDGADPER